jgi:hypothetical protein
VDYTIAGSALAVPSRACGAVRINGKLLSKLPSIGLFTGVRGSVFSAVRMLRSAIGTSSLK